MSTFPKKFTTITPEISEDGSLTAGPDDRTGASLMPQHLASLVPIAPAPPTLLTAVPNPFGSTLQALMTNCQRQPASPSAKVEKQSPAKEGLRKKHSPAQIVRRRERNRILARGTRMRKKSFYEGLQKEFQDLLHENQMLKDLVKTEIEKEASEAILVECNAETKIPQEVLEAFADVIVEPQLHDNPAAGASDDFMVLSDYAETQDLEFVRRCLTSRTT